MSGGALGWLVTSACSSGEPAAPTPEGAATPTEPERDAPRAPTSSPTAPTSPTNDDDTSPPSGATPDASVADAAIDAAPQQTVTLYDTYAVALYFDGGLGPTTGIIKVADVAAGKALAMDFWHGHGGVLHRFTLMPADFALLKQKKKVMTKTTIVEGHQHELFVDPIDPKWRVPGAQPITIPA